MNKNLKLTIIVFVLLALGIGAGYLLFRKPPPPPVEVKPVVQPLTPAQESAGVVPQQTDDSELRAARKEAAEWKARFERQELSWAERITQEKGLMDVKWRARMDSSTARAMASVAKVISGRYARGVLYLTTFQPPDTVTQQSKDLDVPTWDFNCLPHGIEWGKRRFPLVAGVEGAVGGVSETDTLRPRAWAMAHLTLRRNGWTWFGGVRVESNRPITVEAGLRFKWEM